ncbi:unnamed protein product [Lampetra planeri]
MATGGELVANSDRTALAGTREEVVPIQPWLRSKQEFAISTECDGNKEQRGEAAQQEAPGTQPRGAFLGATRPTTTLPPAWRLVRVVASEMFETNEILRERGSVSFSKSPPLAALSVEPPTGRDAARDAALSQSKSCGEVGGEDRARPGGGHDDKATHVDGPTSRGGHSDYDAIRSSFNATTPRPLP